MNLHKYLIHINLFEKYLINKQNNLSSVTFYYRTYVEMKQDILMFNNFICITYE